MFEVTKTMLRTGGSRRSLALLLATVGLAGCGGGNGPPTNATQAPLELSAEAAPPLVRSSLEIALGRSVGSFEPRTPLTQTPDLLLVEAGVRMMLDDVSALGLAAGTFDRTIDCAGGGSFRATGTASAAGGLTTGDSVSFVAANCVAGTSFVSYTFSGSGDATLLTDSTLAGQPAKRFRLAKASFFVKTAGGSSNLTLDATFAHAAPSEAEDTVVASGSGISGSTCCGGAVMTAFTRTVQRSGTTYTSSLDADFVISIRYQGERFWSVRTQAPVRWTQADAAPAAGTLKLIAGSAELTVDISPTIIRLGSFGSTTYAALP